MKGLYIHIPFCESICHYCDFVKRKPKDDHMIDEYLDALHQEIASYRSHFSTIETIYIGGGTPSMLSYSQLRRLFEMIKEIKPSEYTIEVNPESYTLEKGELFKEYGINRISLGVQTFNEDLLQSLNRKHTKSQIYTAIHQLKSIGIDNISVDLIYAIPGQTLAMLDEDLDIIESLKIPHVSCYSLILEEKTYFYHLFLKGLFKTMDEDTEALMYEKVMERLQSFGYEHYEISNYAKDHHYSKHNLLYWTLGEYIGVGAGAHGLIDGYRTYNHRVISTYLSTPLERKEIQTREQNIQDELIFGLRKMSGINIKTLEDRYDFRLFERYPKLNEMIELGLVLNEEGQLKLTQKGIFLGNQVFSIFV